MAAQRDISCLVAPPPCLPHGGPSVLGGWLDTLSLPLRTCSRKGIPAGGALSEGLRVEALKAGWGCVLSQFFHLGTVGVTHAPIHPLVCVSSYHICMQTSITCLPLCVCQSSVSVPSICPSLHPLIYPSINSVYLVFIYYPSTHSSIDLTVYPTI